MDTNGKGAVERRVLGRYIVADPEICHGQPTFLGTRIMVSQVLKQLAKGMTADAIIREWRGTISAEAIAEVAELGDRALVEAAPECAV